VRGGEPLSVKATVDAVVDDVEDEVVEIFSSRFFEQYSYSPVQTSSNLFDVLINLHTYVSSHLFIFLFCVSETVGRALVLYG
jgi:hypothetical protein